MSQNMRATAVSPSSLGQQLEGVRVGPGEHVGFLDPAVALDRRAVEGHALFEGGLELGRRDLDRLQKAEHVGEPEPHEAHAPLLDRAQDVLVLAFHEGQFTDGLGPASGRAAR